MNQESSSATGRCPYPDCGATVNLGTKFCKTCGRAIHRVVASPTPVADDPHTNAVKASGVATRSERSNRSNGLVFRWSCTADCQQLDRSLKAGEVIASQA